MKNLHFKICITFIVITSINSFLLAQSSQPAVLLRCINQDSSIIKLYQNDLISLNTLDYKILKKLKLSNSKFYTLKGITSDSIYLGYKNEHYNISRENVTSLLRINDEDANASNQPKETNSLLNAGLILLALGLVSIVISLSKGSIDVTNDPALGCALFFLAIPISITGLVLLLIGLSHPKTNKGSDKLIKNATIIKLNDPRWSCSCYKLP